jgi:hydroxymethylglutaryl-CoA reductase (NADPH)
MPISRTIARDRLAAIRSQTEGAFGARLGPRPPCEAPLPPAIPRDREGRPARAERLALLAARGAALDVLAGERTVVPPHAFQGNVENFIGMVQVPAGVIGPLRINGLHAHGDFYVPLATTEGALVASHARGAAAIGRSGGARSLCVLQRVTRAPLFRFRDLIEAGAFIAHAVDSFPELQARAHATLGRKRPSDARDATCAAQ